MSQKKEIYFHVGTGKTGTTFLQYRIFPKFKNIYYIQRTRYKHVKKILNSTDHKKYLISREFDQQLEHEVKKFSKDFPATTPIIVFRRQDSYIASQYRRFVKNGYRGSFTEFLDLEHDNGFFKQQDLNYCHQINILEKYFSKKPIVLFYEELKDNPNSFIEKLTQLLTISIDYQAANLNKKHTSYSEKQLKAIQSVGKYINLRKRRIFKNSLLHLFFRTHLNLIRYSTLYISKYLPASLFKEEPLISKNELEKVRKYYEADWEKCIAFSKN